MAAGGAGIAATGAEGQPLRVFMCEFVTGGGLRGETPPASLAREGAMMRDALARDLGDIPGVEIVATHDDRLSPAEGAESVPVGAGDDPWAVWAHLLTRCDFAYVVAPETGGALLRLATLVRRSGAELIGPDEEAIRLFSSKRRTAERLRARGVAAAPVWRPGFAPPAARGLFVSKPDDGAGCEATRLWSAAPRAADLPRGHVVQPFVGGLAASATVLTVEGETRLLSANRQNVAVSDGAFVFRGLSVAAINDADGRIAALARSVAAAAPGLSGIYGIDMVIGETGPVVVEVNPRLTTAYAGLREALGVNPAALLPPFASLAALPARLPPTRAVELAL